MKVVVEPTQIHNEGLCVCIDDVIPCDNSICDFCFNLPIPRPR